MTDMQMLQHLLTKAGESYIVTRCDSYRDGQIWRIKSNGLWYEFDYDGNIQQIITPRSE